MKLVGLLSAGAQRGQSEGRVKPSLGEFIISSYIETAKYRSTAAAQHRHLWIPLVVDKICVHHLNFTEERHIDLMLGGGFLMPQTCVHVTVKIN